MGRRYLTQAQAVATATASAKGGGVAVTTADAGGWLRAGGRACVRFAACRPGCLPSFPQQPSAAPLRLMLAPHPTWTAITEAVSRGEPAVAFVDASGEAKEGEIVVTDCSV